MNEHDALQGEMPGFRFPGRPGGDHDEPLLDMIIARRALPPDAPAEIHDLARMVAALAGPAEPGELAGEAAVRAAFSRAASPVGISSAARRPVRRRRPRHRGRDRSRAWMATAMVAAVAGLGSILAAYSDVLPSPIQRLAHVTVAAPAPPSSGPRQPAPMGTGDRAPHTAPGASQPAPVPDRSVVGAQTSGQPGSPRPHFSPEPSRSHGQDRDGASCGPSRWPWPGPSPRSTRPIPWSQTIYCGGIPTGPAVRSTPNPHVP